MPINFTDFSRMPVQDNGLGNLLGKVIEGIKAQRLPGQLNRQQEQEELKNAMSAMQNKYYPLIQDQTLKKGDLDIQGSELNLGALPERLKAEAKQRELANQTSQINIDQAPEKMQLERDKVKAAIAANQARANKVPDPTIAQRRQQKINSNAWDAMPPNVQQNTVAVLNGLGVRPDKAVNRLANGETVEEIGASLGYTPEQIDRVIKKNVATNRNVSQENQRNANVAELNVLEERVSDAMAPYVQTFAGMSPKAIIDQFKGGNDDELAKYLAARSLQSELAALRLKVMSANVGQGALHEMVTGAFGNSKVLPAGLSPEVYRKMNHYVGQWLNEASKAANNEMFGQPTTPQFSGSSGAAPVDPWGVR